ncbi:MAG: C40 family peptidase [Anditalea sp.]
MKIGFGNSKNSSFFFLLIVLTVIASSSCSSSRKIRTQNINQVVETAKSYHGTPYRYGGTTRSGIDCSALVYHSFKSVGVTLPRTSAEQSKIGKRISVKNLEKGDVIFFATGKRRRKVTHAGIVTSKRRGNIQFIHATTSLGVTEDNVYSNYWSKKVVRARRVF